MIRRRNISDFINRYLIVIFVILFFVLSLPGLAPWINVRKVSALEYPQSLTFNLLGTHPQAAAQSSANGKRIRSLKLYDGKLLAGYGDYNANTGPIAINPYNITNNTFEGSELSVPTEALSSWTEINGKLYTPTIDPTCSGTCSAGFAVYTPGIGWEMKVPVNAEHIFDIETLTGTDIWLFGSAGGDTATAWRSTDGGENFQVVRTNVSNPGGNNTERYYWGKPLNGKMYMQSILGNTTFPVQIYDGNQWSEGTDQRICGDGGNWPGPNPVTHKDLIVCPGSNNMTYFDGTSITQSGSNNAEAVNYHSACNTELGNVKSSGGFLYALCWTGTNSVRMLRTSDASSKWINYGGLPALATSIEIDSVNNKVYVGTSDSKIYSAEIPTDTESPSISIVSPTSGYESKSNALRVKVNASDNNGITKVEALLNGQKIGEDYNDDQEIYWEDTNNLPAGTYTLTTKAYDYDMNETESDPITISLSKDYIRDDYPAQSPAMGSSGLVIEDTNTVWTEANKLVGEDLVVGLSKVTKGSSDIEYFWSDQTTTFNGNSANTVAVDLDNNIWLASCDPNTILETIQKFDQVSQTYTVHETTTICGLYSSNILTSPSGNVWYINDGGPAVLITPDGNVSYHEYSETRPMTMGGYINNDGNLVLQATDFESSEIVTMNQNGDVLSSFDLPEGVLGYKITSNSEGNILMGNVFASTIQIYEISSSGEIINVYISSSSGYVTDVVDDGSNIWFSSDTIKYQSIMRINKQTHDEQFFAGRSSGYSASSIAIASDNTIWSNDNSRVMQIHPYAVDSGENNQGDNDPADLNNDSIPDVNQPNISSYISPINGKLVVVDVGSGCVMTKGEILREKDFGSQDSGYDYANGLFGFEADCTEATTTIKIYYYDVQNDGFSIRKFNRNTSGYINLMGNYGSLINQTVINNKTVTVASYSITDGGPLDQDGVANGTIIDPVGLAAATVGVPNTGL